VPYEKEKGGYKRRTGLGRKNPLFLFPQRVQEGPGTERALFIRPCKEMCGGRTAQGRKKANRTIKGREKKKLLEKRKRAATLGGRGGERGGATGGTGKSQKKTAVL